MEMTEIHACMCVCVCIYIYTHTTIKTERNFAICNITDGPGGYYISEISLTEKGKYCVFIYMWNLKNK